MPLSGQAKRDYQREWVATRRAAYLHGRSCVLCGSAENLEFDHANPEHKVSHRVWSWSRERLEAELAKCVILCRRCHQERHSLERPKHGSGGYKRGCRCEVCMAWKREANARSNAKRRRRESDPGDRLCRPAHNHSATAPMKTIPLVNAANPSHRAKSYDERKLTGGTSRSSFDC